MRRISCSAGWKRQLNPTASTRRRRGVRAGRRQREGLLGEDVLAGARGGDDLLGVLRVRRGEDDRVDARIGERSRVVPDEGDAVGLRERARLRPRAHDARREADLVALALRALDEVLAPAAQPDDGGPDH
jgi:hypothetical protein